MRIYFSIEDAYLLKKAQSEIPFKYEVCDKEAAADAIIRETASEGLRCLEVRTEAAVTTLPLPIPLGDIGRAFTAGTRARLTLSEREKAAILDGSKIPLTDIEYATLSLRCYRLIKNTSLLKSVFPEARDEGSVNVYVHYLRAKLEAGGERIIITSRNRGYAINEKFTKEGGELA